MNPHALDRLDDLGRRIVVALQRDGRASWRAIADVVGASVTTVARRGQQLLADGVVKVAVVPALSAGGPYASFWVRINCRPGMAMAVAATLSAHQDVRFCSTVSGEYDLMAEIIVRGGATNQLSVVEGLRSIDGVERWRSDLIMHVYKVSFQWGRQLYGELLGSEPEEDDGRSVDPVDCGPDHFDAADLEILSVLREDGRETFQRIADRLGINESSVRRRFDRLRAGHCVEVHTLVSSAALGMNSETLMTIKVSPSRIQAVGEELAHHPSVRFLASLVADNSLLCEVITPSVQELHTFLNDFLARLDGVEGWSASMELLYLKRAFVETPWWSSETKVPGLLAELGV
ncbi:Lrp/AsnC family transcriptional regulator [Naasia aerilata]|uniref:HTH asnC-type domain-containing protein n=1 Tax=Naasia aerilata TaxID=1162966 RepID=A0ABN6XPC1_9MICO|nr:Lrp/AsnC family transcriptional regulator [Naasia aerilata]BDZ46859.1 hypothetical protein GCM10025866_27680 [Naasia aerilata]